MASAAVEIEVGSDVEDGWVGKEAGGSVILPQARLREKFSRI